MNTNRTNSQTNSNRIKISRTDISRTDILKTITGRTITRQSATSRRALLIAALGLLTGFCAVTNAQAQTIPASNLSFERREQLATPAIKTRLQAIRATLKAQNLDFGIGYTTALDRPLSRLATAEVPKDIAAQAARQARVSAQLLTLDREALLNFKRLNPNIVLPELKPFANPKASSFDWRTDHGATPVRDQHCGDCWAFASIGAYEGSYLIRHPYITPTALDLSEQYMVDSATYDNGQKAGSCTGGWHAGVFEYLVSHGTMTEAQCPENGTDAPPPAGVKPAYRAVAWSYVTPDVAPGFEDGRIPTTQEMKQALCDNGPLAVAVLVTDAFRGYTGNSADPVFKENLSDAALHPTDSKTGKKYHNINHDITLIGWDDSKGAWLIKNSWGKGWGNTCGAGADRGYMWIAYNTNNVGFGAAWVRSMPAFYLLSPKYFEIMPNALPFPTPEKIDGEKIRLINSRALGSIAQP